MSFLLQEACAVYPVHEIQTSTIHVCNMYAKWLPDPDISRLFTETEAIDVENKAQ